MSTIRTQVVALTVSKRLAEIYEERYNPERAKELRIGRAGRTRNSMTNAEYYEIKDQLAEQACVLLVNCNFDRTKIDDGLWNEFVRIYKKIEDYV